MAITTLMKPNKWEYFKLRIRSDDENFFSYAHSLFSLGNVYNGLHYLEMAQKIDENEELRDF